MRNNEIKEYHKILCNDYPNWLDEYINTIEMQRLAGISISCGTDYSGIYNPPYIYSNLMHSIGVALIIWNFTKDKKKTISGLFHDIATPVFKHCIDFMNKDYQNQESTEEKTVEIIKKSKEIMRLLNRDGINVEEVADYKIYPIADNQTPKLSADRLEYTFSSGLCFKRVWEVDKIEKMYNDLVISKNDEGEDEISFSDKEVCEEYIEIISKLWPAWVDDNDRTVMQFLADICKAMIKNKELTKEELYELSEAKVVEKVKNSTDEYIKQAFAKFEKTTEAKCSKTYIKNKYCVNVKTKQRYVNPHVVGKGRIYEVSENAKKNIDSYLGMRKEGITYLDLEFNIGRYE